MFSKELVRKLMLEVLKQVDSPSITPEDIEKSQVQDTYREDQYEIIFGWMGQKPHSDLTVIITEHKLEFEVKIVPDYKFVMEIRSPLLGLSSEIDVNDYMDLPDEIFADANAVMVISSPFIYNIPKTPELQRVRNHMQDIVYAINQLKEELGEVEGDWRLKYWYMREAFLPAFEDQTTKHKARQLIEGLPALTEKDVIKFIWDLTNEEGGWNLQDIISNIKNSSN